MKCSGGRRLLAAAGKLASLDAYANFGGIGRIWTRCRTCWSSSTSSPNCWAPDPDLAELFVTIGRIGRSDRHPPAARHPGLDTGRIRGLESHLSYRICLRTFSEAESREAIGGPDAYHLPAEPGWGYLRGDGPELRLFRAVTVSRPYRPPRIARAYAGMPILPFSLDNGLAARVAALHESRSLAPEAARPPVVHPLVRLGAESGDVPANYRGRGILDVATDRSTTLGALHPQGVVPDPSGSTRSRPDSPSTTCCP